MNNTRLNNNNNKISYDPIYEYLFGAIKSSDFIVLNGLPSVGKTTLLKYVLSLSDDYISSYINCNSIGSSNQIYSEIITQLCGSKKPMKIKSSLDFVETFQDLIQDKSIEQKYIVSLDRIEFLRETPMLECLTVLTRVKNLNIIIVTNESARCIIDDYFKQSSTRASLEVRLCNISLSPWEKEDIVREICKIEPKESAKLYRKFVNNVVQIVYTNNTRDFVELRTYCQDNFEQFLKFHKKKIRDYLIEKEPEAKHMTDEELDDYIITVPAVYEQKIASSFLASFKSMIQEKDMLSVANSQMDRKVVTYTSILIVAAYIAGNTKPSDDKKNFVQLQKRKARRDKAYLSLNSSFTMERLLQIFKSLLLSYKGKSEQEPPIAEDMPDSVLADISTLENLGILKLVSGNGLDSLSRYQFSENIERSYVKRIADQNGFDLNQFYGLT